MTVLRSHRYGPVPRARKETPPAAFATAVRTLAADPVSLASGDLQAVRHTRHGVRLLIGDVRGQGPHAAAGAAVLLAAFDRAAPHAPTLPALVDALEGALLHRRPPRPFGSRDEAEPPAAGPDEDFATLVAAQISPDGSTLHLLNRGHPAPLLLRGGRVRPLNPHRRNVPLGLSDLDGASPTGTDTVLLPADATLLFLTDGVTEARDTRGAFYDPVGRLAPHTDADPEALLDWLRDDVQRHAGGRVTDDMALLAVRRVPREGCVGRRRHGRWPGRTPSRR